MLMASEKNLITKVSAWGKSLHVIGFDRDKEAVC
jgi:hypothetical protein